RWLLNYYLHFESSAEFENESKANSLSMAISGWFGGSHKLTCEQNFILCPNAVQWFFFVRQPELFCAYLGDSFSKLQNVIASFRPKALGTPC
ncbi:MAG: hypothetical protein RIQ69_1610, partial [Pseudomonadota bacterium]